MAQSTDFTAVGQQQRTLDELLTTIAQAEPIEDSGRNGHDCEVEALCHERQGVNQYRFSVTDRRYICGWRVAGTVVQGCHKRRRLLSET